MKKITLLVALFAILLTGCRSFEPDTPDFDITGTWEYSMSKLDEQDEVYDAGTITFSGTPSEGTYLFVNTQGEEMTGTYVVSRVVFGLDGGDEFRVKGSFPNADNLFGTWESGDSRGTVGKGGLWTAERK